MAQKKSTDDFSFRKNNDIKIASNHRKVEKRLKLSSNQDFLKILHKTLTKAICVDKDTVEPHLKKDTDGSSSDSVQQKILCEKDVNEVI